MRQFHLMVTNPTDCISAAEKTFAQLVCFIIQNIFLQRALQPRFLPTELQYSDKGGKH